jgi:hypothetical protein
MSAIDHSQHQAFRADDAGRPVGFVAHAERFGREVVWLLIAVAFLLVEAAVFLTDLPVARLFSRRAGPR